VYPFPVDDMTKADFEGLFDSQHVRFESVAGAIDAAHPDARQGRVRGGKAVFGGSHARLRLPLILE
jgi:hypothetical protein